jgi:hypothetical protein
MRFDPYDELLFHDCGTDLWGAIELETGEVRGDLDPEVVRAGSRAVFAEAERRMEERLGSGIP